MEIDDCQINLTELYERGQQLLKSKKMTDCKFLIGTKPNQRLFSGHRLILAMASPIFECMFYGDKPEESDPIILPNVEPNAFEALLNYIYTDGITITSFEMAWELYFMGVQHMLPKVKSHCAYFMTYHLTLLNVCHIYQFANFYKEQDLKTCCMNLIVYNTMEIITNPLFLNIDATAFADILYQPYLNVNSELDLYNWLIIYIKERCRLDIRGLRKAVKNIRFLNIPANKLNFGSPLSRLLTQNEMLQIRLKHAYPFDNRFSMPAGFYPYKKDRKRVEDTECVNAPLISIFSNTSLYFIRFKVDKKIFLSGVRCNLEKKSDEQVIHHMNVLIQDREEKVIEHASDRSLMDTLVKFCFPNPVFLSPNTEYRIGIINRHGYSFELFEWQSVFHSRGVNISILGVNPDYKNLVSPLCSFILYTHCE